MERYNVLFIEPFFGGSHKDFMEGFIAHSDHYIDRLTMKDRFWKWRMRGASLHVKKKIDNINKYQLILTTDMINLADLKALYSAPFPPVIVYFHENQMTYPVSPGEAIDYHYGFTNIITALCADRILFNSRFHYENFFSALPPFLKMMPDYRPHWVIEEIRKKSAVAYPGCHMPANDTIPSADSIAPLIIWNHRWEHDKNPELFFSTLERIDKKGIDFRLAVLGENYQSVPPEFERAKTIFSDKIVQYGYAASREDYFNWLQKGDIIISTAFQENFGISVIEAIASGCFPLLPKRLSYPEIIEKSFHSDVLYLDEKDLASRLERLLTQLPLFRETAHRLCLSMRRFSWPLRVRQFDQEISSLCTTQFIKKNV